MHRDNQTVCPLCRNQVTELVQHHWFINRTGYIVLICASCNSSLGRVFSGDYPCWEDQVRELKKHFRVFSSCYPNFDFDSVELPVVFRAEIDTDLTKRNLIRQLGLVSTHHPRSYSLTQNRTLCDFWTSDTNLTLSEVGRKFHITGARVSQILKDAGLPGHRFTKEQNQKFRELESTIPSKEKVRCELCGRLFPRITPPHLRYKHNTTTDEYIEKFPSALLVGTNITGDSK